MTHDEAIRCGAAERHVSGELPSAERDAFEEHFFDCPECAEEVRWELIFAANARALLRERAAEPPSTNWFAECIAWFRPRQALSFSLAANALLVLMFGLVFVSRSREPIGVHLVPAYFAPGPVRGPGDMDAPLIPAGMPAFLARIPSPGARYSSYSYIILNADGKREMTGALGPVDSDYNELYLEVSLKDLPQGVHTLEVLGNPEGKVISRTSFHSLR